MTRHLILALLLAHVLVAFWAFGPSPDKLWPVPGQTPGDPERVALQIRPEAIVLVRPSAPAAAAAAASSADVVPTAAPSASAAAPAAPSGSAPTAAQQVQPGQGGRPQ